MGGDGNGSGESGSELDRLARMRVARVKCVCGCGTWGYGVLMDHPDQQLLEAEWKRQEATRRANERELISDGMRARARANRPCPAADVDAPRMLPAGGVSASVTPDPPPDEEPGF